MRQCDKATSSTDPHADHADIFGEGPVMDYANLKQRVFGSTTSYSIASKTCLWHLVTIMSLVKLKNCEHWCAMCQITLRIYTNCPELCINMPTCLPNYNGNKFVGMILDVSSLMPSTYWKSDHQNLELYQWTTSKAGADSSGLSSSMPSMLVASATNSVSVYFTLVEAVASQQLLVYPKFRKSSALDLNRTKINKRNGT